MVECPESSDERNHVVLEVFGHALPQDFFSCEQYFTNIMTNNNHVLYSYLPERRYLIYNLRERSHNRSPITKTIPTSMNMTFSYGFYTKIVTD